MGKAEDTGALPAAAPVTEHAGHDLVAYSALTSAAALYAGGGVAAKVALLHLPPIPTGVVRFVITSAVLALMLAVLPGQRAAWPRMRDWPVFLVLGATGVAGFNIFYFGGMRYTTASEGVLFTSSSPLMTVILAAMFTGERLTVARASGAVASVIGMGLVALGGLNVPGAGSDRLLGDVIILGAAFSWAIYTIVVRRVSARYSPTLITFVGAVVGLIIMIPFGAWQMQEWDGIPPPPAFWWSVLYMALGTSVAAYVFWIIGVQRIGPSRASVFLNLAPVLAIVFGALLLGERLTAAQMLGVGLVLAGLYLVNQRARPRPADVDGRA